MTSISNVDLVMAALRSRLRRAVVAKRSGKAPASSAQQATRSADREKIAALDAIRRLSPEEFEHTLVRAVLESELGEEISDDPRFSRLVDQTHRILQEDPELKRVLRQIRLGQP